MEERKREGGGGGWFMYADQKQMIGKGRLKKRNRVEKKKRKRDE